MFSILTFILVFVPRRLTGPLGECFVDYIWYDIFLRYYKSIQKWMLFLFFCKKESVKESLLGQAPLYSCSSVVPRNLKRNLQLFVPVSLKFFSTVKYRNTSS